MAAEAEAARESRAKVIQARGEQKAAVNLRTAGETISDSSAALHLRYLQVGQAYLTQYLTHTIPHSYNTSVIKYLTHAIPHSYNTSLMQYLTHAIPHSYKTSLMQNLAISDP